MGRLAFVTGANRGIGTAICRALADDGHRVIAAHTHEISARQWLAAQADDGYRFDLVAMDVSDFVDAERGTRLIKRDFGAPDIVVNNAGTACNAVLKDMTVAQWLAVMRANLDSVFAVSRQFINDMLGNGWGRIVNVLSISGPKERFGHTNYFAAKAGVHGFTLALAEETARKGITVNSVSPGDAPADAIISTQEDIIERVIAEIPGGRHSTADEIAAVVRFLCSESADFITGTHVPVGARRPRFDLVGGRIPRGTVGSLDAEDARI